MLAFGALSLLASALWMCFIYHSEITGWLKARQEANKARQEENDKEKAQAWERKMRADIAALDSEIQAAKEAYNRQRLLPSPERSPARMIIKRPTG
jgi:hypothetical protein